MVDTQDVDGLDPYDMMESETARLDAFFAGLDDAGFARPSRCGGLVSARHARSLHVERGLQPRLSRRDGERLPRAARRARRRPISRARTRSASATSTRSRTPSCSIGGGRAAPRTFATCGPATAATSTRSVGPYPARWQAFHLAFELAIHADDIDVPVATADEPTRTASLGRVARFLLKEAKPDAKIESGVGTTRVQGPDVDIELPDAEFVPADRRPPARGSIPAVRDYLLVMS